MKLKQGLGELLKEKGKITPDDLDNIKNNNFTEFDEIKDLLVSKKVISEKEIMETVADNIGVPYIDLTSFIIDPAVIELIDEKTARRLNVVPLYIIRDTLSVAMVDPQDIIALDELSVVTKYAKIRSALCAKSAILKAIEQNYSLGKTSGEIVAPLKEGKTFFDPESGAKPQVIASLAVQAPVVKFVNQMIFDALKERASDIHIEQQENVIRIRFRVDGMLHTAISLPKEVHLPLIPRIKILSVMDIAEARNEGMNTLKDDGIRKVKEGITTIEEVLRVTQD